MRTITLTKFIKRFNPLMNSERPEEFWRFSRIAIKEAPADHIWSVVHSDGTSHIVQGRRLVNVEYFIRTVNPWPKTEVQVKL